MAVRERGDVRPFVVGNDAGYFCGLCLVVVLDYDTFTGFALLGTGREDHAQFTVLGLVDSDAIPEEKSDIPLAEDENSIPLVEFTNLRQKQVGDRKGSQVRAKRKRGRRRKRRK